MALMRASSPAPSNSAHANAAAETFHLSICRSVFLGAALERCRRCSRPRFFRLRIGQVLVVRTRTNFAHRLFARWQDEKPRSQSIHQGTGARTEGRTAHEGARLCALCLATIVSFCHCLLR